MFSFALENTWYLTAKKSKNAPIKIAQIELNGSTDRDWVFEMTMTEQKLWNAKSGRGPIW